jgi:hypothetical protein
MELRLMKFYYKSLGFRAVVAQESSEKLPPLHKSDLLPNWQQKEMLTPVEKLTEDITSDTKERELLPLAIADGGTLHPTQMLRLPYLKSYTELLSKQMT